MEDEFKTSAASRKAVKKYHAQFDDVRVRMKPEDHEKLKAHAEKMGESVTAFLKRAIAETIARDNNK